MDWLEIDSASRTMSPDEAMERQRVHESMQELLLACQLIAIPRLSR